MAYTKEEVKACLESHTNSQVFTKPEALDAALLQKLHNMLPAEKRHDARVLLDSQAYLAFIHNDDLVALFDPNSMHAATAAGHMGVLLGMDVLTDSFYPPATKILPQGRIYVMTADGSTGYGSAVLI